MSEFQINKNLTAASLNSLTTAEAAVVMGQSELGPKYLPLCPADHTGVSDKHKQACSRPGKVPLIAKWTEKATDKPDSLQHWFSKRPNSNLGMTLGGQVGIVGFDIDGAYGQTKMEQLFNNDIPPTWQFSTPGGGLRFLFHVPEGVTIRKFTDTNSGAKHEELALLADGQMTVIPPSQHHSGGQYLWMEGRGPGDLPLAELPRTVLDQIKKEKSSKQAAAPNVSSQLRSEAKSCSSIAMSENALPSQDKLQLLSTHCKVMEEALSEQQLHGCSETQWHYIVSMLTKAGYTDTAMAFSQLSQKHTQHSEQRIREMDLERPDASYGPTRCTTFGCGLEQIAKCHSSVHLDEQTQEPKNSPVTLLLSAKKTKAKKLSLEEYVGLMKGNHDIHQQSLCKVKYKKDDEAEHIPLANFVARIVKSIEKDNGAEKLTFYEIDGLLIHSQKRLHPIQVPAQEFESMKWLTMWGPEPTLFPGSTIRDLVRFAIQSTASAVISERIFTHLGWIKLDGKWAYLHAGGALGVPNVKVELETRLQNYQLTGSHTSSREAMETSLNLLNIAPHRVTLVLWALTYLSPLCEWLRWLGIEPKFLVWLHGYTGSRKTTLAKLFLCHFGDLLEHPPASFKDTANSVERRGFDTKDSLLLIDDYHPTSSPGEKKKMESLAQQILRGYGDRVGRGRMKQDTSLRPDYPPRGNALVTAEDLLGGGSSVARLFPAELLKTDVNLELLTQAQDDFEKLSAAMSGYLDWVGKAMNTPDHSELRRLFVKKRQAASHLGVHGRLVEAAVWLYLGLSLGLEYAESVGAITADRGKELRTKGWNIFLDIANEQGQQVTEIKPSKRFITIVSQLLANQSVYCDNIDHKIVPETVQRNSSSVGWKDDKYYYFLPDLIYNEVSQLLAKRGEQFPISPTTLWKELAEAGLTQTEVSKEKGKPRQHFLVKKTVKKQRQRLLWVKKEALLEEVQTKTKNNTRSELLVPVDDTDELGILEEF
ncbi:bifunctional DNA primase/polymerase [Paenibacillus polymyxa]|uniref:bifunctional DNA primase/polymerase n=1 Tax=Paenibacillus polymyxa TaxID=1406 RepID=UPI0025B6C9B0|nr:bifunctional DNA primase/polymerase [Paenibacillus polymyxa]MDN4081406.1 bifunctional DNA primase/polymerase [Paenibacillus polymyxa]MDN4109739.1 bifunctional DNA primase/polymerase [Paenibacillus polymyxa]